MTTQQCISFMESVVVYLESRKCVYDGPVRSEMVSRIEDNFKVYPKSSEKIDISKILPLQFSRN